MKIAFYLGTYGTEPERMVRTLMQNRDWMVAHGIEPVSPARHRALFDEALASLGGDTASAGTEEVLLDALIDGSEPEWLICAQPSLLGSPAECLGVDGFYAGAGARMLAAARLFPSAQTEFFLALRNPATLIPLLLSQTGHGANAIAGRDPAAMRWAPAIRNAVQMLEGRRLILWCHEDTPLIWPEVLRRLATMPAEVPLKGGLSLIADLLTPEGLDRLRAELAAEPQLTVARRRDIFTRALSTDARPEAIEMEIDLPGWDQALVDRMTAAYAQDVAEIAALPGIEFITP